MIFPHYSLRFFSFLFFHLRACANLDMVGWHRAEHAGYDLFSVQQTRLTRILYGQDKHLPFISEVGYYMGLYNFLCRGHSLIQPTELKSENAKPSPYCKERETLWITVLIFFFPKLKHKARISKQQQEILLYI